MPHVVAKYQEIIGSHVQISRIGIFVARRLMDGLFDPIFTMAISLLYPGITDS